MIQAYNHFLTEYSSSLSPHSLAHKPKELRDVYGRIVNMSRHTAWYKLDFSKEKRFFSLSLKDYALTLSEHLEDLSNVFRQPTEVYGIHSSSPDIASAKLADREYAPTESISLRVHKLAGPQVNQGLFLPSDSEGPMPGSYRFHVQIGEDGYEFSYKVSSVSTNRELMEKLSDFINKSSIRIRSSLEDDREKGLSRLVISSVDTGIAEGEELAFTISDSDSDSSGLPGLVSSFGLDRVVQRPRNACVFVNGREYRSPKNEFIVNRGFLITLKKASDKELLLSPETAGEQVEKALGDLINSYNTIIDLSRNGPDGNRRSAKLLGELNRVVSSGLEELSLSGIHRQEDLKLAADPDALHRPETVRQLKSLFEEPDGLLARLSRKMQDIVLNPMEYVDKVIITYPNLSRTGFSNPYSTSIYSGMMFNSYC